MFASLVGFVKNLIAAEYSIYELIEKVKSVLSEVFKNTETSDTAVLVETVKGMLASVLAYLPWMLIALCVIEVFFGKKLFGIQKFLICFFFGFMVGAFLLSDFVNSFVVVYDYILGAVVGFFCAVLYKIFYFIGYVGTFGYLTYLLCFSGSILAIASYTKDQLLISLGAAVVVVILALIFHNFVEMIGTSALGAYGIVAIVDSKIFDFANIGIADEKIIKLAIIGVIVLAGFIVQFKTRKRY